jgi:starch-binding outer membrane protein SusE/F
MKSKLLSLLLLLFSLNIKSQVISMIGSTSPSGSWTIDTVMETTDNITYTLNNVTLTTATDPATTGLKFRQDGQWTTNWGNSNFPSGTATLNGPNIMTVAGTYNVTFNRINGTYTFISTSYPIIGIWGPAVDSQNGYAGDDIEMQTTDGIIYTLGDFYFSSGNAYFRQDNDGMLTFGTVAFPTGTAVTNGPPIFIPGGEYFVTFNRNTGEYSFEFPRIGILGSALGGFGVDDTDLITSNGFEYSISNLLVINGELKFRKNDSWGTNWGATDFPSGTGTQNGPNIPIGGGAYNVTFERTSGNYSFVNALSISDFSLKTVSIAPNPTTWTWTIKSEKVIDSALLIDINGKSIQSYEPKQNNFSIDASQLSYGTYFVKLVSGLNTMVQKIVKN